MTPQNEAEYYKRVSNFEIYNCKEMKEEMVNWISEQSAKVSLFSNPIKNITGSWWFDYTILVTSEKVITSISGLGATFLKWELSLRRPKILNN